MTEFDAPENNNAGQAGEPQQQAAPTTWFSGAADETVGYIQNKGWDNPLKVVDAYRNLEAFRGVPEDRLIKLPKEDEPFDEVYKKLGRPDDPNGYDFKLPDEFHVDENRANVMKDVAHKIGLNPKQFQALVDADSEYIRSILTSNQQKQEDFLRTQEIEYNDLRKEWGKHADEREELARRFVRNHLPKDVNKEEFLTKLEGAVGTANLLKLFANAGEKFREDVVPDSGGDRPFGYTREQAINDKNNLMNELKADRQRLANYNNMQGTDYQKMQKLQKIIHG